MHLFTTGQGNIGSNAIVPFVEISANPGTAATIPEHVDVDVYGLLGRRCASKRRRTASWSC